MKTKILHVKGNSFSIAKNVAVRAVNVQGMPVHWRMHKTVKNTVQLRHGVIGPVTVYYEKTEPVAAAAYYPLTNKAKSV
jgi:hypothetical protein